MHQRPIARLGVLISQRWDSETTDVIPVGEFGSAVETFGLSAPFATDAQVLAAPELDDLNDMDEEEPRLLIGTATTEAASSGSRRSRGGPRRHAARAGAPPPVTAFARRDARTGRHHKRSRSRGAAHCRLIIAALAGGAGAAGAFAGTSAEVQANPTLMMSDTAVDASDLRQNPSGLQIVRVASTSDAAVHSEELARGTAFAQERAQREARMQRPRFTFPAWGILTSSFGTRWGTLHGGLDIANAIGTPIYAASDGEVVAAGPTPGFGMWVKIRDTDGTVTLYGHIDTATVQVGDRVLAGDQIATVGNRGNSTGPHLHFEVHRNGVEKIDPTAWLQQRGVTNA